jgi:hypothetical protein
VHSRRFPLENAVDNPPAKMCKNHVAKFCKSKKHRKIPEKWYKMAVFTMKNCLQGGLLCKKVIDNG